MELLNEAGFRPFRYDPMLRQMVPYVASAQNAIFLRDLEQVMQRVKAAGHFRLVNGIF
jgi:hypothetical protein